MLDKEIPRCTRVCFETKKTLEPGDRFRSVLLLEKGELKRRDYSEIAWKKAEKKLEEDKNFDVLCSWSGKMAVVGDHRIKLAPNDILLDLFDRLAEEPDKADIRYVLTLLLIRRRIFRYDKNDQIRDDPNQAISEIQVYSPRRETVYSVQVLPIDNSRIEEIQDYLASLLYSMN